MGGSIDVIRREPKGSIDVTEGNRSSIDVMEGGMGGWVFIDVIGRGRNILYAS